MTCIYMLHQQISRRIENKIILKNKQYLLVSAALLATLGADIGACLCLNWSS